jgi:PAS domain S-box-containing protein
MSNLTYFRKFILLGGLSLSALLIVSTTLISNISASISRADLQLEGFNQAQNISRLIQSLQKSRGITAAVLTGVNGSIEKQSIVNKSVSDRFLIVTNNLPEEIKKSTKYSSLLDQWEYINTTNLTVGLEENFNLHTKLISNLNSLQLMLADRNLLFVMDDNDSYYLTNSFLFTVPIMLETLAKARGVGVSYLVDQNINYKNTLKTLSSNVFIPLKVFKGNISNVQMGLNSNIESVSVENFVSAIEEHVEQTMVNLIDNKLVLGKNMDYDSSISAIEFYNLSTSVIDNGYQFLDNSLYFTLSNLLENRVRQSNIQLILSIGVSSVLFVIVLYFIIGLYLSTIKSINSLTQTTTKFYDGNLNARVNLNANDELNKIAVGLNDMATSVQKLMIDKEEMSTRLRAIIDNSPIGIWFTGLDGRFHFVNRTFTDLVGVDEREFINTPVSELANLLGSETANNCLASDKAALTQETPFVSYETIPRLDEKACILEITKVKMKNAQGELIGLIGISKDITKTRQQEDDLKLAEMVYSNSSEAMMVTNDRNEIIAINPALSKITGYSKNELIGKDPKIFSSGKQSFQFYSSMWKEL